MPDRRILHGTAAQEALTQGINTMADVLRITLGPTARMVAVTRPAGTPGPPEMLNSAATIARRTIQLPDPFADMGGMIVRHMAWRVFAEVGDGTATAAVILQRLVRESGRYIAAGGHPMLVKRGIERGLAVARAVLKEQVGWIDLPSELARVAAGALHDPTLAAMIGEIVDAVGPDGDVTIEDAQGTETVYEYVDGLRWEEGYLSPFLVENGKTAVQLIYPRIFVTDHDLEETAQLLPVIEACVAAGERNVLIIAPRVSGSALALLLLNKTRGMLDGVLAVRAPPSGLQRADVLDDIAALTGGRSYLQERFDRLHDVTIDDLGRASQAWATNGAFGILGGAGNRSAVHARIRSIKARLATERDENGRTQLQQRMSKLTGISAIIRVGARTASDTADRKERIQAAVTTTRQALAEGVVPGGGAALLACIPALEALTCDGDEAFGIKALATALTEPMRAILENAGVDAGVALHQARQRGSPWVFDTTSLTWVNAWVAGIVDPLSVTRSALETSVSAAIMTLTTDVLIRSRNPSTDMSP